MRRYSAYTLIVILSVSFLGISNSHAEGLVKVGGHKLSLDSAGLVHISGIVENQSEKTIGMVRVTAHLFDENGNKLPTLETYALLRTIPPGFVAPFDIPISDKRVGDSIHTYKLSVSYREAQSKDDKLEFSDVNAFVWTHIDPRTMQPRNPHGLDTLGHRHGTHAHTEITALVANSGETPTKTVKVFAIWYDEKGQYYGYSMQTVARQISPSDSNKFVIMTHPTMAYYSLIAESEDYVSMKEEDGERMFRVYEANNDNTLLAGVDTMSISDMIVRNGENSILGKIPVKSKPVLPHFEPLADGMSHVVKHDGQEHEIEISTYDNALLNFEYDEHTKTMALVTDGIKDQNGEIHVEIIVPDEFDFVSAESFDALLNGASLHRGLFYVDPYSYPGKTAMHFILSNSELKYLAQDMNRSYADRLEFSVRPITDDGPISISVGEPVQIQSIITNYLDKNQQFVYIMQVKDSNGAVIMISWIDGSISASESISAMLSWMPDKKGSYSMQIFLWESLSYPSAMSSNFANAEFIVT